MCPPRGTLPPSLKKASESLLFPVCFYEMQEITQELHMTVYILHAFSGVTYNPAILMNECVKTGFSYAFKSVTQCPCI